MPPPHSDSISKVIDEGQGGYVHPPKLPKNFPLPDILAVLFSKRFRLLIVATTQLTVEIAFYGVV